MNKTTSSRNEHAAEHDITLVDAYNRWFEVVPARSPSRINQVHRLRHQVYCIENNFEDPNHHKDGIERDEYDDRSVHSLLVDRATGTLAGTVRLILPAQTPSKSFPIQNVCKSSLLSDPRMFYDGRAAEISRFCISKEFRQKARESLSRCDTPSSLSPQQLLMPCITLGLMKAIVQMSAENGITDWFAVMEPPLLRLLTRFGIYFKPIGPLVEYHGMRQPCYENVKRLLGRIKVERKDVWDVITDEGRLIKKLEKARQESYLSPQTSTRRSYYQTPRLTELL